MATDDRNRPPLPRSLACLIAGLADVTPNAVRSHFAGQRVRGRRKREAIETVIDMLGPSVTVYCRDEGEEMRDVG